MRLFLVKIETVVVVASQQSRHNHICGYYGVKSKSPNFTLCFQIHLILLKHDVIVQFMKLLEIQAIFL